MTNLEALKANIGDAHGLQLTDNHFTKALLDQELQTETTYYSINAKSIDMATIACYDVILGAANMSEGDVTYTLRDLESIKTIIDTLLVKWGKPARYGKHKAKVTGVNPW